MARKQSRNLSALWEKSFVIFIGLISILFTLVAVKTIYEALGNLNAGENENIIKIEIEADPIAQVKSIDGIRIVYYSGTICGDRILRAPGGLYPIIASYCINDHGEFEIGTSHLLASDHERLIGPIQEAVQKEAENRNINWRW